MEMLLLRDFVIIFGLSIVVLLFCHRLKIPSVVGFLITGIVAGPSVLGFVSASEDVKLLAEIGIIVLLFTVGLEFSIKTVLEHKRSFMIAGPIQVGLTVAGGFFAGQLLNRPFNESIFLGFLVSLSSTAIVMRILQERAETNTPHGRLSLGILIFQDIVVVLMMLVTPFLSGKAIEASQLLLLLLGVIVLVIIFYSAVKLVPRLLYYVAKTKNRELFLLTVLVVCFSVTWITSAVGLSLALGAFLAGIIISDSEFSTQAIGDIIPLQDIFTSFFFISIGMLLDIDFFIAQAIPIFLLAFGVFLLKSVVVTVTGLVLGLSMRTAILSGMALSQVGEFSFVLATAGIAHGLGTEYLHQVFIAVAILTMGVTPMLIGLSPKLANWALELPLPHSMKSGLKKGDMPAKSLQNHIIVVGYGFSGRNLTRSSREAEIPYVIIDMDPETVREERKKGEPIYFGDATRDRVLSHVNIERAKVVAILVNDPIATLRIIEHARKMNSNIYIIVRTRYLEEMGALYQMGADDVIPDELGSTVEIFSRVLTKYQVPQEHIEQLVQVLRVEGYDMLRPRYSDETLFSDLKEHLADIQVKTLHVKDDSPLIGKTLKQLELRKKYGITILVIKRGSDTIYKLDANTILFAGDDIVIAGTKENVVKIDKSFFS